MRLAVSGKFSKDVFDEAYDLVYALRYAIERSQIDSIPASIDVIAYYPVILSDDLEVKDKSRRSYSRKERSEVVNAEIPYHKWQVADRRGKISLLVEGLRTAVADTNDTKISPTSKRSVIEELDVIEGELSSVSGNEL